jgi:hypothetical protein
LVINKTKYVVTVKRGCDHFGEGGETLNTIHVRLHSEACGNFDPIYCTYQGKKHLVQSRLGDISDPFRREQAYLDSLFIKIE